MSLCRALPWLLLLVACDDDATAPLDAGSVPDAGGSIFDASAVETFDGGEWLERRDASVPYDATIVDAGDASADAECASLDLSYDNYGAQFLELWCLSCHAKMEPYFTTPELARQWAPAIYLDAVATKRMPPGGNANYLRDEQRRELGRWLNCGAP